MKKIKVMFGESLINMIESLPSLNCETNERFRKRDLSLGPKYEDKKSTSATPRDPDIVAFQ
ncbi:hypothetical protein CL684_00100 [Candidatus Campbellbacteria bacterium]|nr:hypothetical protein [Candidatus Campbellbacteria bacterium]|tara:strand:+ start:391 stop:573 length:183 start_codon:yes stop_codon:yes gene_type:complete